MKEDPETDEYVPAPVLAGWSPGDEEIELPKELFKPVTEEQQTLCTDFQPWKEKLRSDLQFEEFPLYYSSKRARISAGRSSRGYFQGRAVLESLHAGVGLVLADQNYTVFRANSIWKLIWVYTRHNIKQIFTRKTSKPLKMPIYTET